MSLRGKVALVTGGSRGIGKAVADALAEQGMSLVIAARTEKEIDATREELARIHGTTCVGVPTDVAQPAEVSALVRKAREALGRIDVLVNAAGIVGAIGELHTCALEDWRRAIEVNLLGTVHTTREVLPIMRAQRAGKIINFAGGGVGGPNIAPRLSAYVTSKAAVVQFTECIAKEVGADNVQINAVSPGAVLTAMTAEVIAAGAERAGRELYERTQRERATGSDRAEHARRLVVWLASESSGSLSGKLLSAVRDQLDQIDVDAAAKSSRYTLRRIDEHLYHETGSR